MICALEIRERQRALERRTRELKNENARLKEIDARNEADLAKRSEEVGSYVGKTSTPKRRRLHCIHHQIP